MGTDRNTIDKVPARFADTELIADGAEGGSWVGTDVEAGGRRVVLKRVASSARRQLAAAFSVLRRVSSPHLPAALELIEHEGETWLVTAWIEGAPLGPGPAPLTDVLAEALGVAHALAAIHRIGTHHGDVSANNVLRTATRGVVLTDFGQVGGVGCGTPGYLAPEVLAGGGGPLADRFALGCLICFRLFGQVPWRTPEALVRVREAKQVRARLDALAEATDVSVPAPVRRLIERLLAPAPRDRVQDADLLVRRLGQLHQATLAGADVELLTHWWPPSRWPYHGPSLQPLARALASEGAPSLVLVHGPAGSGRRRVVEELVMAVQERGDVRARLVDPDALGRVLGRDDSWDSWIDAWLGTREPRVVGVAGEPAWSGPMAEGDERALVMRAALLRAGATMAGATLVLPVSTELARAIEAEPAPGVQLVEVPVWTSADIGDVLDGVLDGGDVAVWAEALRKATGGAPARVVRAIEDAARRGDARPDAKALASAAAGSTSGLEPGLARQVMLAHWGARAPLPVHLADEGRPLAWAVAAARRTLGDELHALATERIADTRDAGERVTIELALDAGASDELRALLARDREQGVRLDERLATWVEGAPMQALPVADLAYVVAGMLSGGEAKRALALAERGPVAPRVALERGRALQQLGRAESALACLDAIAVGSDEDLGWMRLGLRLRVLVDLGRAKDAVEQARMELPHDGRCAGCSLATAWLWAGMAAMYAGDDALAGAWLGRAADSLGRVSDRKSAAVHARILQLQANLADARGDLVDAAERYRRARESFERAEEPVGALFASSSLATLAFPAGEIEEGVERGRAALRGLVARAQVTALPVVLFNLSQCLIRVEALDEVARWRDLVGSLVDASGDDASLARARLARVDADLVSARAQVDRRAREEAYVRSAEALEQAQAGREAADAWLRAASHARLDGRPVDALTYLERADAAVPESDDVTLGIELALERLAVAVASGDARALAGAAASLRAQPGPDRLLARGQLELAWIHDRGVLVALQTVHGVGDPATTVVVRRMLSTLEALMSKVSTLDRPAARAALLSDAGDASPLRDLVRELGEDAARLDGSASAPASTPPASEGRDAADGGEEAARLARIIRIYRRLAREDQLERLLEQVVEAMMELTDAERGVVVVRREGDERLEVAREIAGQGDAVTFSRSVISRVLDTAEPVISVDAAEDDRFDGSRSISHLSLRSVLAVPLVFRGEVLGAAYVDHRLRRGAFDERDLGHVEDFADLAALAVANARALDGARRQADALQQQGSELEKLLERREAEVEGLREEVRQATPERRAYRGMVGSSDKMQKIFRLVDRLAESDVPVVIYGESGTGKELVARAIHDAGPRAEQPFVAENCGAIPETLLESVLFGHAKGAFTGAQKPKAGLFEAAHGGTIFLDEVGEMSPGMQTKLLRVLQEGEVRRVGENASRKVDVRVIAASNRDLEAMVEEGSFRQDLFYRINVVKMEVPALRSRPGDIPALVEHLLERHQGELEVSASAMRALVRYPWPGNVRELENEVQRWVALVEDRVRPDDLSPAVSGAGEDDALDPDDLRLRPRVDRLERELIAKALERTGGNQTQAAQLLGLSRFGLQKKLKRQAEEDEEAST